MNLPQFIYLFYSSQTLWLFQVLGYYEKDCLEHLKFGFVHIFLYDLFLKVSYWETEYAYIQVWKILPNSFPKQFLSVHSYKQYMRAYILHLHQCLICQPFLHLFCEDLNCENYHCVLFNFQMINKVQHLFVLEIRNLLSLKCLLITFSFFYEFLFFNFFYELFYLFAAVTYIL